MKYLKYFPTEAEYNAFIQSEDFILPNVSYIVENDIVNYNPYTEAKETRVVCTYNVTNTAGFTKLCQNSAGFTSMEVDGVMMDKVTADYSFDTLGEHTVKFELADSTTIGNYVFMDTYDVTSVVIPDSVTSIGSLVFGNCYYLTSVVIPDSVTTISTGAFINCSSLTEIVCHAVTVPTIQSNTFKDIKESGVLKVPVGSDYSAWMNTDDYYLGKSNWTIEYI